MKKRIMSIMLAAVLLMTGCQAKENTTENAKPAGNSENQIASVDYPSGDLRILVPFPTGGFLDVQVRTVAKYLAEELGVNVIVENKPGAGGMVGITDYLSEKPNTNTIVLVDSFLLTGTPYITKVQYAMDDYMPIIDLKKIPYALFTNPDESGIQNFDDLKNSESVKFGSDGPGTFQFAGVSTVLNTIGVSGNTVTFDGAAAGIANMVSGVTDIMLSTTFDESTRGYVQEGKLVPLVYLGDKDYAADDVYTEGIPCAKTLGVDVDWHGFYYFAIRKGSDQAVADKLYDAFDAVYQNEEFLTEAEKLGILCTSMNGEEINNFLNDSAEAMKEVMGK